MEAPRLREVSDQTQSQGGRIHDVASFEQPAHGQQRASDVTPRREIEKGPAKKCVHTYWLNVTMCKVDVDQVAPTTTVMMYMKWFFRWETFLQDVEDGRVELIKGDEVLRDDTLEAVLAQLKNG